MKPYIHNPTIYRHHYRSQVGSALAGLAVIECIAFSMEKDLGQYYVH